MENLETSMSFEAEGCSVEVSVSGKSDVHIAVDNGDTGSLSLSASSLETIMAHVRRHQVVADAFQAAAE